MRDTGLLVYWGMRDFVYLSALLGRILLRNNRTVLRLSNYLCEVMDQGPRLPSVLSSRPELGMLLGVRPVMGLPIRAYPKDTDYVASADEYFIDKRWTKLVLDWE